MNLINVLPEFFIFRLVFKSFARKTFASAIDVAEDCSFAVVNFTVLMIYFSNYAINLFAKQSKKHEKSHSITYWDSHNYVNSFLSDVLTLVNVNYIKLFSSSAKVVKFQSISKNRPSRNKEMENNNSVFNIFYPFQTANC